jgi:hypothetical protein
MQDVLVLGLLGLLRVGVPILVIAGIGYYLVRRRHARLAADIQAPVDAGALGPADWARAITAPPAAPCWEQKNCDVGQREACAAYKRSHVPCWLAVQVAEGQLRSHCLNCDLYRVAKRDRPYLRLIKGRGAERQTGEAAVCAQRQGEPESGRS